MFDRCLTIELMKEWLNFFMVDGWMKDGSIDSVIGVGGMESLEFYLVAPQRSAYEFMVFLVQWGILFSVHCLCSLMNRWCILDTSCIV